MPCPLASIAATRRCRAASLEARSHLADARRRARRQFDGVVLVVIPGVQVGGIAVAGHFLHSEELSEEPQALLELGGQQFDVAQVRHVMESVVHREGPLHHPGEGRPPNGAVAIRVKQAARDCQQFSQQTWSKPLARSSDRKIKNIDGKIVDNVAAITLA
jgi:hypothetical protein